MLKPSQFIDQFRRDVDDLREGTAGDSDSENLWSDPDVYRYLNAGLSETARRTFYLLPRIIKLDVTAGNADLGCEDAAKILHIERARLLTARISLEEMNMRGPGSVEDDYGYLIHNAPDFENTVGTPYKFIRDYAPKTIRLYPVPMAADTLQLHTYMLPSTVVAASEVPSEYAEPRVFEMVLMFMKSMAYQKQDADTQDLARSGGFSDEFEAAVRDFKSELLRRRRTPGTTRFSW